MIRIELSPNDKKDLLQLIRICEQHTEIFYYDRADFSKWWLSRLDQLRDVINGITYQSYIKSSFETIDRVLTKEQKKERYKEKLEGEIIDVFDSR
mgnify:CR=1 FL=1